MKFRLSPGAGALAFSLLDSGSSSPFLPLLAPLLQANNPAVRPWTSRLGGHRHPSRQDGPHFPQTATEAHEGNKRLCKCFMCAFAQTGILSHAAAM